LPLLQATHLGALSAASGDTPVRLMTTSARFDGGRGWLVAGSGQQRGTCEWVQSAQLPDANLNFSGGIWDL
jgi:hypothetical protein